ncbi:MAG TPA: hypothetical protein VJ901_20775 [Thermoanaerobaculia bacterium]|nr:hypothetical protein [Thermoanaerobaculia bacterium]
MISVDRRTSSRSSSGSSHATPDRAAFFDEITRCLPPHLDMLVSLRRAAEANVSVTGFAEELGLANGVTGFIASPIAVPRSEPVIDVSLRRSRRADQYECDARICCSVFPI